MYREPDAVAVPVKVTVFEALAPPPASAWGMTVNSEILLCLRKSRHISASGVPTPKRSSPWSSRVIFTGTSAVAVPPLSFVPKSKTRALWDDKPWMACDPSIET